MSGSELATRAPADLSAEELLAEQDRLAGRLKSDIGSDEIALPLIKLAQALSNEVKAGKCKPGEYINSVTGRVYGDSFELIVVDRFKGRFFSPDDSSKGYAARGDVAPDNWPKEYAGKRFDELPDAEELFKQRANDGQIEWGKGPPISTTANYIGFVKGEVDVPVRLSLMRTNMPAATTINTLIKLSPAAWDNYVKLGVDEHVNKKGQKSPKVVASEGEPTTEDEKLAAIRLALELERVQNVVLLGDEADAAGGQVAKPTAAKGAMEVE